MQLSNPNKLYPKIIKRKGLLKFPESFWDPGKVLGQLYWESIAGGSSQRTIVDLEVSP